MKLEVLRFSSQNESTLGLLFEATEGRRFLCFTLEDRFQEPKVPGKTRIPAGTYPVKLRTEGSHHERYGQKFPGFHKGMLWIDPVPGFQFILIHIGNTAEDTEGCLLVGNLCPQNIIQDGFIGESTDAYKRIYPPIAQALSAGEAVTITFIDYDRP